jgi:hypothetical protein
MKACFVNKCYGTNHKLHLKSRFQKTQFSKESIQINNKQNFCILSFLQCCGYWMFIPDPGSRVFTHPGSRIPDPKTATKETGEKISRQTYFYSQKFHKIENYFIFEMLKKKNLGQFLKTYYPKNCY